MKSRIMRFSLDLFLIAKKKNEKEYGRNLILWLRKNNKRRFFAFEWKLNKYFRCLEDLEDVVNFLSGSCSVLWRLRVLSTDSSCGGLTLWLMQNANIAPQPCDRRIHTPHPKSLPEISWRFSIAALLNFFIIQIVQNKINRKKERLIIYLKGKGRKKFKR